MKHQQSITFRLPEELKQKISEFSEFTFSSESSTIRLAILEFFDKISSSLNDVSELDKTVKNTKK